MTSVTESYKQKIPPHLEVRGGEILNGYLKVNGAKNSALVLMAAAILGKEPVKIKNIPDLTDICVMVDLLRTIGVNIARNSDTVHVDSKGLQDSQLPHFLAHRLRASFFFIGPLLARLGHAEIPLPGGCAIGARPVDEHIRGLESLGAGISFDNGVVKASILNSEKRLQGANVSFNFPSVGATETIIMAASTAKGKTIIRNAAKEPEIQDLSKMLNKMGAKIKGAGSSQISIEGVEELNGCTYEVMPDRIEAGTLLIAAAITRSNALIGPVIPSHLNSLLLKLKESGCHISQEGNSIRIIPTKILKGVDITTAPFPGFPTDLQAPFMALMATAKGKSNIIETVYENRMQHISQLNKMGASIELFGNIARVQGVEKLKGSSVSGSDLRSAAAIVLASIAAKGESKINGLHHLDRGYDRLEDKLNKAGAKIYREENINAPQDSLKVPLGAEDNKNIEQKAA